MTHNIEYLNWTFTPDKIREGNLYLVTSLLSSALEVNTLFAAVECLDPSILDFERNAPLLYYTSPDLPMIFRVQNIKRVGPGIYEISATSTLGLLTEGLHYGGIYTGQTAQEVVSSICGTVPFIIKNNLAGTKLYGYAAINRCSPHYIYACSIDGIFKVAHILSDQIDLFLRPFLKPIN